MINFGILFSLLSFKKYVVDIHIRGASADNYPRIINYYSLTSLWLTGVCPIYFV